MKLAAPDPGTQKADPKGEMAPRDRILAAAGDLFYRHGIRAVGVEAVVVNARVENCGFRIAD